MASASDTYRLDGKHVLITGGQGFIGRHTVEALAGMGAHATSVVNSDRPENLGNPLGAAVHANLEEAAEVAGAIAGHDLVVHLAARAGGIQFQDSVDEQVFSTNRLMTDNVLRAASEHRISRVFLASSSVIYDTANRSLRESDPHLGLANEPSPYAWSKITDEVVASWVKEIDTIVGRFGNVYGPGAPFDPARSTVIHALIDRAARLSNGEDLVVWGDGSAVRSFIFVEDAAQAVAHILTKGQSGEAYNIDSGEPISIAELAAAVRDAVNPSLKLVFDKSKPAGAPYRVGSADKLRGVGFTPSTRLSEGLSATVEWYRAHVARS